MTETEYNIRLKKIEADYELAKKNLYVEYAMGQAKFKKGDIIKNSVCTILVDRITTYKWNSLPEPVYHGVELKKDLAPKKSGDIGSIYGNHDVELIKSAI